MGRRDPTGVEPVATPARPRGPRLSGAGLAGAAILWVASLAPSLLPRPGGVAVALLGLCAAIGYGLGCLLEWAARPVARRLGPRWRVPTRARSLAVAALWLIAVVMTVPAQQWQQEQAAALGMPAATADWWVLASRAVVLAALLVLLGRGVRAVARTIALRTTLLPRPVPSILGVAGSALTVVAALWLVGTAVDSVFGEVNARGSGLPAPASSARSGGPGSLVRYDDLGGEGQRFVNGAPTVQQISAYTGHPALEPIRIFVGLLNAPTAQQRAQLAVDELRRTGGLDRHVVAVSIPTGNGYVDPFIAAAPELLSDGNVATVATQYSVLPSWLSFLVDQQAARTEADTLLSAVSEAIAARPPDRRPLLVTCGESLGALGDQAPFSGDDPAQVASRVDSVVWIGSPAASSVWPAWRDSRASGPPWEPGIGDGSIARNPASVTSTTWQAPGWQPRRQVVTQHANDPVSWWTPALAWQRPDWLDHPQGPGVDPRMTWWPGVFFLQTGLDLVAAGAVPPGVGHNYTDVTGQAWAYALGSPGAHGAWSSADTTRLQDALN